MLKNDKFIIGAVFGVILGTMTASFAYHKLFSELIEITDRSDARHRATIDYTVNKLGPYAPSEVLEEVLVYFECNVIEAHESI